MKCRICNGTFEQVEHALSESFIKNSLDTIKTFRGIKSFAFIILFIVCGTYVPYGVSLYIANNMEEAVGGLDLNNEFIPLLSSIWYINLQAIPIVILVILTIYYRDRNRIKGHYIYYSLLTIFSVFFGLFLFKVMQLFVSYFILRMLYLVLYGITFVYSIWQGYQNALNMVYGEKKNRSKLVEWFSRNSKTILTILAVIGGAYFAGKAIFEPAANMERRIIGSMADFLPLLLVLANFAFIYYIGVIVKSYYAYKYSEKFSAKFQYDKKEWYGPKHKD